MGEFLILPQTFVDYVNRCKKIPVPMGDHIESLQSAIELVCLEASMERSDGRHRSDLDPGSAPQS